MSVTAITSPPPTTATTATNPLAATTGAADSTTATTQTLGENDFLQLLATQLAAQDPMQPTDDTQFISQMASFSSLQQMQTLNTSFTTYAATQQASTAPQFLGKQVTVSDANGNPITGVPTSISMSSTGVSLIINGTPYPMSSVTSVANAPSSGS